MKMKKLKDIVKLWKYLLGIVFIGFGISETIKHGNFWMLLFIVLGIFFIFLDKDKVKEVNNGKVVVLSGAVVILISVAESMFSVLF